MKKDMNFRLARPAHPGRFIRTEILEPLGLDVTRAAQQLGVARPTLSRLLNEKASLSPEMAVRVQKAFGPRKETLLRMQASYDAARIEEHEDEIHVGRYQAPAALDPAPHTAMACKTADGKPNVRRV